jgi:phosphatidate phosphatase APP1
MAKTRIFRRLSKRLARAVYLLGRPARGDHGEGGTLIQPYRGFASEREIFLMGRIFRQQRISPMFRHGRIGRDLLNIGRRLLRRGAPGVVITARFGGAEEQVTTDRDGYFSIDLQLARPIPPDRLWHRLSLEANGNERRAQRSSGLFFHPPPNARFVVLSDIDDTVIFTGVTNKLKMLWRLFIEGARERVAFPGVAAFYRALHGGVSGAEFNPMLYVSLSPWGLYELLEEFFHLHQIPAGPILFLREWGMTLRRPFPRRSPEHKITLIRRMLGVYQQFPFILIGDSGQHDPEIYAQVVREHPGRVLAVYIRDVSTGKPGRQRAIRGLAAEVVAADSSLLLVTDTLAMAEHAVERGFIPRDAIRDVRGEIGNGVK